MRKQLRKKTFLKNNATFDDIICNMLYSFMFVYCINKWKTKIHKFLYLVCALTESNCNLY